MGETRSLSGSFCVFDTSRSVNTALRGADRVYVQYFDAERSQHILATSVSVAGLEGDVAFAAILVYEIRGSRATPKALKHQSN